MFPLGRGERRNSSGRDRAGRTPVILAKHSYFFFFVVRALNRYVISELNYRSRCSLSLSLSAFVSLYAFFRVIATSQHGGISLPDTDIS